MDQHPIRLCQVFILFSNENGTRYEANFSFWLTGMKRGVAALRRVKGADARMEKARVDVPVEFEKSIIPKIVYESRQGTQRSLTAVCFVRLYVGGTLGCRPSPLGRCPKPRKGFHPLTLRRFAPKKAI